jgi:hypothetical protein
MDVLVRTKELLGSLADVTESGSKIARFRIEVANLDRKLGLALRKVGERAWQMQSQGRTDVLADGEVQTAFEEVRRLRARMEAIQQELQANRGRASEGAGKAARIVREEAGKAATTLRAEGARAAAAVKKAVGAKDPRKKTGKETSDLQP